MDNYDQLYDAMVAAQINTCDFHKDKYGDWTVKAHFWLKDKDGFEIPDSVYCEECVKLIIENEFAGEGFTYFDDRTL